MPITVEVAIKQERDMAPPRKTRNSLAAPSSPAAPNGIKRPLNGGGDDSEAPAKRGKTGGKKKVPEEVSIPVAEPEPEKSYSTHFCDPLADFEIAAEDDTYFKIRSYHLLANCPFFQRLQDQGEFMTPHLSTHTSGTIEDLLSIMTRRPLTLTLANADEILRMTRLVSLCKELECTPLLERLSPTLRAAITGRTGSAHIAFWVAAIIEDHDTCRMAIPVGASVPWGAAALPDGVATSLNRMEVGQSTLDPAGLPVWLLDLVPSRALVALLRAFRLRGSRKGAQGDWTRVADEYFELMTEKPAPKPPARAPPAPPPAVTVVPVPST